MNKKRYRFISKVKNRRIELGLYQTDLAYKAGLSLSVIQKIECGHAPTLDTAMRIAEILNTSVDSLWQRK